MTFVVYFIYLFLQNKKKHTNHKGMYNFSKFSNNEKKLMLEELSGKTVRIVYDYSDIPDGSMGPMDFYGRILSVSASTFDFDFLNPEWGDSELTIDGISDIVALE